jgi:hypothetical protein
MLTPKQRIEAYEHALNQIERYQGICWPLDHMLEPIIGRETMTHAETVSYYPEFQIFYDDHYPDTDAKNGYWFPYTPQGNKTRSIILDFCILMAKDAKH